MPLQMDSKQEMVLQAVKAGENVFFTGCAGVGKSAIIKEILRVLPRAGTHVTAATGIAATLIGGTTLLSFAGIGRGEGSTSDIVAGVLRKPEVVRRWLETKGTVLKSRAVDRTQRVCSPHHRRNKYDQRGDLRSPRCDRAHGA